MDETITFPIYWNRVNANIQYDALEPSTYLVYCPIYLYVAANWENTLRVLKDLK